MTEGRKQIRGKGQGSRVKNLRAEAVLCAFLFSVLCPLFLGEAHAADKAVKPVQITAKADREKVNIGDRISVEVTARNAAGMDVWFPDKPENLGEFSLISAPSVDKKGAKTKDPSQTYILGIYTTGTYVIPPMPVKYRKSGDADWTTSMSPQIPITVETLLTGDYTDIRDLKGIVSLRSGFAWKALLITLLLALAGLGLYVWKTGAFPAFKFEAPPPKPAYVIAFQELEKLKAMNLPDKGEVKEYYIRLSDITRHYLENRFALRAPEMTTEEFLLLVRGADDLVESHRKLLGDFLSHCDMVKFAKYGPTPLEMLDSFKAAWKLVEETKLNQEEVKT